MHRVQIIDRDQLILSGYRNLSLYIMDRQFAPKYAKQFMLDETDGISSQLLNKKDERNRLTISMFC